MMDTSGYVKKLLGWLEQGWFFVRNQRKVPLLTNMLAAVFSLVVFFSMLQGRGDHLSSLEPEKHPGAHKQAGTVTEVKPPVPLGD
ncbi:MAG: hypothetical protein GQ559_02570 [Desulfobulbaceae bacterium]|nr:hypothetical protein [Desulfobulbaceae bacterium]